MARAADSESRLRYMRRRPDDDRLMAMAVCRRLTSNVGSDIGGASIADGNEMLLTKLSGGARYRYQPSGVNGIM